jgi:hypothetical protein
MVASDNARNNAPANASTNAPVQADATVGVPLVALAWARSGDKGDDENIAVIARQPKYLRVLREQLTPERVKDYFRHKVQGGVQRYEVPGLHAFNFVLHQALGGGGVCSLSSDPLGKSYAQILLDLKVEVPLAWQTELAAQAGLQTSTSSLLE